MNERIRILRKNLGLTTEKFGAKVGVKRNTVSQWENGVNKVTDQMIKSICREFNVSEKWLRNGIGEMFNRISNVNLNFFVTQYGATELELEILKAYFELDPDIRKTVFEHFMNRLSTVTNSSTTQSVDADCTNEESFEAFYNSLPDTAAEFTKMYPVIDIKDTKRDVN